ncbi:exodeoxyribonuclease VII small subunit [Aggregatilinea lenta]|uniref:exodeoxyribonuclease VII small subunit n=1 Tax=Aggregatilinea lenta TaxID=913108 RepID=UPI000E5C2299|nr:exodeoxyribonuclease VII small subunit [Aggregatilinea lenta]
MSDDNTTLTFEQAFEELETIVGQLEAGDLSLEESVTLYERGQKLALLCGDLLDNAELRIQQLNEDGTQTPFDPPV